MTQAFLAAAAVAAAVLAPGFAGAQGAAPAANGTAPAESAPSVYIQQATLNTVPRALGPQRIVRSCNITGLLRQYCGTAASCNLGTRPTGSQQSFFVARLDDITQVCNLQLSQVTDLRVTYRCRFGDRVDGTPVEEFRPVALEDSGDPLGRAAFRIVMACQ